MKRTPLRRKSRKAVTKELDALCREVVFLRDRHRCQKCGRTTRLEHHHIHTRRSKSARWALCNGLLLCKPCHEWWQANKKTANRWWESKFPSRAMELRKLLDGLEEAEPDEARNELLRAQEGIARWEDTGGVGAGLKSRGGTRYPRV